MKITRHTEERQYKIGDDKFHIRLEVDINRRSSVLEYRLRTHHDKLVFVFTNSRPETSRKILALMMAAVNKVTTICKDEGLHIIRLSEEESGASNGAQADGSAEVTGGL